MKLPAWLSSALDTNSSRIVKQKEIVRTELETHQKTRDLGLFDIKVMYLKNYKCYKIKSIVVKQKLLGVQ